MKKTRAWMWSTGRVLLAVVLLVLIFKYGLQFRDTVTLRDGTVVSGTITKRPDIDVAIQSAGKKLTYPLAQVAREGGDYRITADSVILANGKTITGRVLKQPDLTVSIKAGDGEPVTYSLKDVAVNKKGVPQIEQGLIPILKQMKAGGYVIGLLLLGIPPVVGAMRWRMLLEAQGVHISQLRSLSITLTGLFFNNFMPGLTGGDVIKAYYAAKLTDDRKTHAVVTVLLDRLIGMVALGIVAGGAICAGLLMTRTPDGGLYRQADYFVAIFLLGCAIGTALFYSMRLRALGRTLLHALPGYARVRNMGIVHRAVSLLKKIDSAVYLYRYKKMVLVNATLISFIAHTSAILSFYFFAEALGVRQISVVKYFIVVPISFIVSSLSPTPAGWGVGEYIFKIFFEAVGIPGAAAITMSITYRLTQALWTLPGGVTLMLQRGRATVEEAEAQMSSDVLESENVGQGD